MAWAICEEDDLVMVYRMGSGGGSLVSMVGETPPEEDFFFSLFPVSAFSADRLVHGRLSSFTAGHSLTSVFGIVSEGTFRDIRGRPFFFQFFVIVLLGVVFRITPERCFGFVHGRFLGTERIHGRTRGTQ